MSIKHQHSLRYIWDIVLNMSTQHTRNKDPAQSVWVHKLDKMQRKGKACDQTKYECVKKQLKNKQALIAKFFPEPQRIKK